MILQLSDCTRLFRYRDISHESFSPILKINDPRYEARFITRASCGSGVKFVKKYHVARRKPNDSSNAYRATMRFLRRGFTEARPPRLIVAPRVLFLVETLKMGRCARTGETAAKHRRCCALKHVNTPFIYLDRSHTGAPCGKLTNLSWHLVHDNLLKRVCAHAPSARDRGNTVHT